MGEVKWGDTPANEWAQTKLREFKSLNLRILAARKRAVKKNAKVTKLQEDLFKKGYYRSKVSYDKAITGVMDKQTKEAIIRQLRDLNKDKGTLLGKPLEKFLNNMYMFGYDNTRVSNDVANKLAPKLTKLLGNYGSLASTALGRLAGTAYKIGTGITGKDEAGNAARKFADLDLSDPSTYKAADSLTYIMRTDEPKWGVKGNNRERNQFIIRGRLDLNSLHAGLPQRYNTYSLKYGYTTKDGNKTWAFTDNSKNQAEIKFMLDWIKNHEGVPSKDGKSIVYQVPGGDPYALHGNYSIITDADGSNPRTFDIWDFGRKQASSNYLPGTLVVRVGVKAN